MNWDIVEGKWDQFKGEAQKQWGKITDNEWTMIKGDRTKLSGTLQERYGWAKNDAEREIDGFFEPRLRP